MNLLPPTLILLHAGRRYTLVKNPKIQQAIRAGQITVADALHKPWYLRTKLPGFPRERAFVLAIHDKDALRKARDILNGAGKQPGTFAEFQQQRDARRGITLGALAKEWIAAGYPFSRKAGRSSAAQNQLSPVFTRALRFWSGVAVLNVTHTLMDEFSGWRGSNTRAGFAGQRAVDKELSALSCLCDWAVLTDRITHNPFAKRDRYQDDADVQHCSDYMPDNDQQFHRVLAWGWADLDNVPRVTAFAQLAFMALSGLRPGEPDFLQTHPARVNFPENMAALRPGEIYPMPDGAQRICVQRLKHGQNPAVVLHPALTDFLDHWQHWRAQQFKVEETRLFPVSQDFVADELTRAWRSLGLRELHPHGFGRAYYVRVRRSQGDDDATIALHLGHSSNGKLIHSVYGAPRDPVGGRLHDWLPADGQPAWQTLHSQPQLNIIAL